MKRIIELGLLLSLLVGTCFAQKPNISGVYQGAVNCTGLRHEGVTLKIIHNPDNSLNVIFSTGSIGWYAEDYNVGIRSTFAGLSEDIILESPKLFNKLIINTSDYKKRLRARFDRRCQEFYLERNSILTKTLNSEIKKERKLSEKNKGKTPVNTSLNDLSGFWIMENGSRDDYRLIVEKNSAWIQKTGPNGFLISLKPESVQPHDYNREMVVFRLDENQVGNAEFNKIGVVYYPERASSSSILEHIDLFLQSWDGKWSSRSELRRPVVPLGETRVAGSEAFLYQDWQQRSNGENLQVNEGETYKRLKQTISELNKKSGWRCLAQTNSTVAPGKVSRIVSEENGINRMYLIYSPYGNSGLIYEVAPPKFAGLVDGSQYDYPLFFSFHRDFFKKDTVISLSLKPAITNPSSKEVPVTIYIFGRTPGDYGTGCSY